MRTYRIITFFYRPSLFWSGRWDSSYISEGIIYCNPTLVMDNNPYYGYGDI